MGLQNVITNFEIKPRIKSKNLLKTHMRDPPFAELSGLEVNDNNSSNSCRRLIESASSRTPDENDSSEEVSYK
jgi:hypothetical protein